MVRSSRVEDGGLAEALEGCYGLSRGVCFRRQPSAAIGWAKIFKFKPQLLIVLLFYCAVASVALPVRSIGSTNFPYSVRFACLFVMSSVHVTRSSRAIPGKRGMWAKDHQCIHVPFARCYLPWLCCASQRHRSRRSALPCRSGRQRCRFTNSLYARATAISGPQGTGLGTPITMITTGFPARG